MQNMHSWIEILLRFLPKEFILLVMYFNLLMAQQFSGIQHWELAKPIEYNNISGSMEGIEVTVDSKGNRYIAGNMKGILELPLQKPKLIESMGETDVVLLKFNSDNDLLWAKRLGTPDFDHIACLKLDQQDNVYLVYRNQFTLKISTHTLLEENHEITYGTMQLTCYTPLGELRWFIHIAGDEAEIELDENGNIYMLSSLKKYNPGHVLLAENRSFLFETTIAKINGKGQTMWIKPFEGEGELSRLKTSMNRQNQWIIVGDLRGKKDLNPGKGQDWLESTLPFQRKIILALDTSGNLIWKNSIDFKQEHMSVQAHQNYIGVNSKHQVYYFTALESDLSSSKVVAPETTLHGIKLNSMGKILWKKKIETNTPYYLKSLVITNKGRIMLVQELNPKKDVESQKKVDLGMNSKKMFLNYELVQIRGRNGSIVNQRYFGNSSNFICNATCVGAKELFLTGQIKGTFHWGKSTQIEFNLKHWSLFLLKIQY
jgi:hypothetical protein